jgi:hypothetical protein
MPGLREEVISIICEEWAKGADREIPLNAASISERLQKAGGTASESEVQLELSHLIDHGFITQVAEPSSTTDVASVKPELCL